MGAPVSAIPNLIESVRSNDPTLADLLTIITDETARLALQVDPPPITQKKVSIAKGAAPNDVVNFAYTFTTRNIILTWEAPNLDFLLYEIRIGTTWNTATRILTTATLQAILDPIAIGTTTYLIKAINSAGVYSLNAVEVDVVVPALGVFTVTSVVLGNFVLLTWTIPTSTFDIDHYIIKKDGVEFARLKTTFLANQELAGGTFTYSIVAYDIFGNASASQSNTALVPPPSDFVLKKEFESAFAGTKTNVIQDGSTLLVCIDTGKTWATHFSTPGWANINAQIAAGYPLYIQPDATTGSYKEVFDIGSIYTNTVINLSYLFTLISGSFTVGFSTRVSDDNVSWSTANTNMSFFAASVRYIEVTVSFTASDDKALMTFYHFHIAVNVREEIDSGEILAVSTDVNGTVVTFNKAFKDVDSITVSTKTTTEHFTVVYRFNDVPNPTSFSVFVYDSSGIRVGKTVEWKARGII